MILISFTLLVTKARELEYYKVTVQPVANSPIHRVYRRYTKFRWTQNNDEMCFFAKESIKIFKCFPNKSIKNMLTDYFA